MVYNSALQPCSIKLAKNTYLKACISHATLFRKNIIAAPYAHKVIYGALKNIVQGSERCR